MWKTQVITSNYHEFDTIKRRCSFFVIIIITAIITSLSSSRSSWPISSTKSLYPPPSSLPPTLPTFPSSSSSSSSHSPTAFCSHPPSSAAWFAWLTPHRPPPASPFGPSLIVRWSALIHRSSSVVVAAGVFAQSIIRISTKLLL